MRSEFIVVILSSLALTACENPVKRAVRDVAYQGYEMIGVQKRDLLKRDIAATREGQKQTSETLGDALDQLRKLYASPETELATQYRSVKAAFEDSNAKARGVTDRHGQMRVTAGDLFREWEGEIGQIASHDLKSKSREQLRMSRAKFLDLDRSLDAAERRLRPVLGHLKDHVLYLKHNLNAESLAGLRREHDRITGDVDGLVREMNRAVARADAFAATLR